MVEIMQTRGQRTVSTKDQIVSSLGLVGCIRSLSHSSSFFNLLKVEKTFLACRLYKNSPEPASFSLPIPGIHLL